MVDEVDIYSDLHQEEDHGPASYSDHAELDLLDASVIPRQATPVKKGRAVPPQQSNPPATNPTASRTLQLNGCNRDTVREANNGAAQSQGKLVLQRINALRKENAILRHNISLLFATAKQLISTKDSEIASLQSRLDNIVFKRNNNGNIRAVEKCRNESKPSCSPSTTSSDRDRPRREEARTKREPRPNGTSDLSSDLNTLYCLHGIKPSLQKELGNVRRLEPFKSDLPRTESSRRDVAAVDGTAGASPVPNVNVAASARLIRPQRRRTVFCSDATTNAGGGQKRRRSRSPPAHQSSKKARRDSASGEFGSGARSSGGSDSAARTWWPRADFLPTDVSQKERGTKGHRLQRRGDSPKQACEDTSEMAPEFASRGTPEGPTATVRDGAQRRVDKKRDVPEPRAERPRCFTNRRSQGSSRRGGRGDAGTSRARPRPRTVSRRYVRQEELPTRHREELPRRNRSLERASEMRDLQEVDSTEGTAELQEHNCRDARSAADKAAADRSPRGTAMHRVKSEGPKDAAVACSAKSEQEEGTPTHREEPRRRTERSASRRDKSVVQEAYSATRRSGRPDKGTATQGTKSEERREGTANGKDRSEGCNKGTATHGRKSERRKEGIVRDGHKSEGRGESGESTKRTANGDGTVGSLHGGTSDSAKKGESARVEEQRDEDLEEGELVSD